MPGLAVDRMCAGALTAMTIAAGELAFGAADVAVAGGVEHMGHHPMGEEVDFNPRFVAERLVDMSAVSMGATAENLHDRFPRLTREDADAFAVRSHQRLAAAWQNGVMRETVVPMSVVGRGSESAMAMPVASPEPKAATMDSAASDAPR